MFFFVTFALSIQALVLILLRQQELQQRLELVVAKVTQRNCPGWILNPRFVYFLKWFSEHQIKSTIMNQYPRYPSLDDIHIDFTEDQRRKWIDLSPYMGVPHIVQEVCTIMRISFPPIRSHFSFIHSMHRY